MTKKKGVKKKDENPPREVLERMANEELTPVPEEVLISNDDIRRAVEDLKKVVPDLFEEESDVAESG